MALRIYLLFLAFVLGGALQGSWLGDGGRDVIRNIGLFYAQQSLPETFFRHAKWAPAVSPSGAELERVETVMADEDFTRMFPPIDARRAVDIYYIVGVTQFLFEELRIKALPVGGTLLGILRNGGQLPHDDDADFAVLKESIQVIQRNERLFNDYGLGIRKIPGLGIQIYPKGDGGTWTLAYTFVRNSLVKALKEMTGLALAQHDLTERGFIDVMPIRYHDEDQVYRYAGALAEEVWWQQTIAPEVFENDYLPYPYGPLAVMAPERALAERANEEAYPHSLTHAMRTPDHRQDQNLKAILVPLSDGQKRPYPLDGRDLAALEERFAAVGLSLQGGHLVVQSELAAAKPSLSSFESSSFESVSQR